MKRILILLTALTLLCVGAAAAAGESADVTLEVRSERLPLHAADDPFLEGLVSTEGNTLPVLVLPMQKDLTIQTAVGPATLKDRRVTLTAEDPEILRVQGNNVRGLKTGETTLTIAAQADPSVTAQYLVAVIKAVNRITVTASEKSVAAGQTISLSAAFQPADATLQKVVWSSADESVATVDENGNVTGLKRGTARIVATAADGSGVRANIGFPVMQNAEEITLDRTDLTVDTGRNAILKATVLPKDTNDKKVVWSSSDESVATVNAQGRVTGVALGDCEIICASAVDGSVQAKAAVHVQQPVTKITFGAAPAVYVNESAQLTWTTEPANASNPAVKFVSVNPNVLSVSEDGTVTGLKAGEGTVRVESTDGSNRKATLKVKVYQHVESVRMTRLNGYIDLGTSSTTGAVLSPKNAANKNMTWVSADPSIATVEPLKKEPWRVSITGVSEGQTTITGTTEDGGHQASMNVYVGHYQNAIELDKNATYVEGDLARIRIRNVSGLHITSVTATVTVTDIDGNPVPCNSKDGSSTFKMVYKKTLAPGDSSSYDGWRVVDYSEPSSLTVAQYEIRITEYQIDNDWVKTIRQRNQPSMKCPVHN